MIQIQTGGFSASFVGFFSVTATEGLRDYEAVERDFGPITRTDILFIEASLCMLLHLRMRDRPCAGKGRTQPNDPFVRGLAHTSSFLTA